MGLLSFFSKTPEKLEQRGDTCFAGEDFGSAKIEYEKTLEAISKKCPDDSVMKERVLEKLQQSKEALALEHIENGENLVEADIAGEARLLFNLAYKLTEKPEIKAALKKKLEALDATFEDEYEEIQESATMDYQPAEVSDSDEFHILCATLSDEMADAYLSYGDLFVEGYLALSRGDFETAARQLKCAMADHPSKETYIPLEYATALIHLKQTDEAMEILNGFVETHPDSIQGIILLCDLLCESKMFDKAHHLIDSAPDSVKQTLGALLYKGRIYFLQEHYPEAEALYQNFLKKNQWNDAIARALVETLEATGKKEEARDMLAGILNHCTGCGQRPDPFDKKKFAELSFELKDYSDKILELHLSLAKETPGISAECYERVSEIYRARGNEKEAARYKKMI